MVLLTMIGRIDDGLLLSASVDEDQFGGKIPTEYQNKGKRLFKTLTSDSPTQMTLNAEPYLFHYLLENRVCYLCLCEKGFLTKHAFIYLEELATEFQQTYGNRIYAATRPYNFIEFAVHMNAARKKLNAAKSRRNINMLSNELQGVQKIMIKNLDDVLQRGVAINELDSKASNLSMMSQNYRKNASLLNTKATFAKVVAGSILFICFALYFWVL